MKLFYTVLQRFSLNMFIPEALSLRLPINYSFLKWNDDIKGALS